MVRVSHAGTGHRPRIPPPAVTYHKHLHLQQGAGLLGPRWIISQGDRECKQGAGPGGGTATPERGFRARCAPGAQLGDAAVAQRDLESVPRRFTAQV